MAASDLAAAPIIVFEDKAFMIINSKINFA
jgi:hypothetical protein